MEKNEKKLLIIGIIVAAIILIILIVFGIIYYLGIINKNNEEVEINRKGKETATVPSDKNFVEDRDENVIKSNGNINNTTVKDLRNIDYTAGESYQFRDIRKGEKYLEIILDNNERLEARLFGDISKNAVSEFEKTEKAGILKNFKMGLGDLGELIPIFNQNNNSTFTKGHTEEINFNLVPYKGAIVVEAYTNEKDEEIGGYFKIIADTATDSNNLYIKNKGINNSIVKNLEKHGGTLQGRYLRNVVIGQITKNIEALEKRVKEIKESKKKTDNSDNANNYLGIKSMTIKTK